jgi:glycosyltransferase involved in cell wall biosynthesis
MEKLSFNIIANGVWGPEGLSGSDDIFINFAKVFQKKGYEVNLFTWEDGFEMCRDNGLKKANFYLIKLRRFQKFGFYPLYLLRTLAGVRKVKEAIDSGKFKNKKVIVYSASDFYPDSIPGYFFKKWLPSAKWVAGFYLFAPHPFKGFRASYQRGLTFPKFGDLVYWLSQKLIFWLVKKRADLICVTSQPDVKPFVKAGRKPKDILVVKGGIDYQPLKKFQKPVEKIYDAVFVGRFHPQKGVVEMVDIWQEVVRKRPRAKLAVIGLGPMEERMRQKIKKYRLEKKIKFLGPLLGDERNQILQQSRVVLHPAVYDSGGMAPASALACGLPGVSFDLPVFKTYYPQGFLRAKTGESKAFAAQILALLENKSLYAKMSREAIKEAQTWDWQARAELFLERIKSL